MNKTSYELTCFYLASTTFVPMNAFKFKKSTLSKRIINHSNSTEQPRNSMLSYEIYVYRSRSNKDYSPSRDTGSLPTYPTLPLKNLKPFSSNQSSSPTIHIKILSLQLVAEIKAQPSFWISFLKFRFESDINNINQSID